MKRYEFILKDLDCAACANEIQEKLAKNPELHNVNVNFAKLKLTYETDTVSVEEVRKAVKEQEPDVEMISAEKMKEIENKKESKMGGQIARLLIGILIAGIGLYAKLPDTVSTIFIILGYAVLLFRTAKNAFKMLFTSKKINENFLITVSCVGAYLVGEHMEGLMVIILYEIGKILEEKSISKSRKSIKDLMNIKPEYANLKAENDIKRVAPEDVKIGDTILVKEGEKVPLDGIVTKGTADLNTASLTGESKLTQVSENKNVLSGSIVVDGMIEVKVTEEYKNSTVSRILDLVENATDKKAKTETTVSKLAKIYTPVVFVLAILVAIFMPLIVKNVTYSDSIYKALTFLVISCPCSIAISVPLSYFSGIGKASKSGILVKGSDYLDGFKDIGEVIFDKTGTITTGNFNVSKIKVYDDAYTEEKVLELFAIGESFSNHPIAKSIINKFEKEIDASKVKEYKEISGKGIEYQIDGKEIKIGNKNFAGSKEIEEDNIGTNLYLNIDGKTVGGITLSDEIKPDAKESITKLNKLGIVTKMFTGDSKEIALEIAKQVGIKKVEYEMLPQDKYTKLEEELKNNNTSKKISFVGDGINDSPVLARADIGISMGGIGSSSAIEASDVVIMTDELSKITDGIRISKKTNRIIKQNLIFAIGVKILVLVLSILGIATMWQAVFADVGTTLITILNTIRILK